MEWVKNMEQSLKNQNKKQAGDKFHYRILPRNFF